jgi:hypothetical protein
MTMRRIGALVGFVLAATSLVAGFAAAEPVAEKFDVINGTPWIIYHVLVRPSGGTHDWSQDLLGETKLDTGESATLHIDHAIGCMHDVRIDGSNKAWATWSNVDLCRVARFKVFYNTKLKRYEAEWQ